MKEAVDAGTSATGARSTLIPRARSAVAVSAPCVRAVDVRPILPICGGDSVGGAHGIRLIAPPSWSTAMIKRGWPPSWAAVRRLFVRATRAVFVVMLLPKRMTPPTSPRRIRPRRSALGVVPAIATMSFWPTHCVSVGPVAVVVVVPAVLGSAEPAPVVAVVVVAVFVVAAAEAVLVDDDRAAAELRLTETEGEQPTTAIRASATAIVGPRRRARRTRLVAGGTPRVGSTLATIIG